LVRMIITEISVPSKESHHADDDEVRDGEYKTKKSYRASDHAGFELLWVNKENGEKSCFVDLGVYTKNRAFRLWNSSKFGKNVPFIVSFEDKKIYQGLSYSIIANDVEKTYALANRSQSRRMNPIDQLRDFTLKRSFVVPLDVCGVSDHTAWSKGLDTVGEDSTLTNFPTPTRTSHADVSKSAPHYSLPAPTTLSGQVSLSGTRQQETNTDSASALRRPCHQGNRSIRHGRYLHVLSSIQTDRHNYASGDMDCPMGTHRTHNKWSANEVAHSSSHREVSPFPLIDEFVSKFVWKGGVKGILGEMSLLQTEEQLLMVHHIGVTLCCLQR
jgi:hypothetical protein